ncbi:AbrB family transcriptional regulator [Priestia aryabhattai]|uniref:AbrB/MazE/SpoVT family DNA-binding domain-containing protein n=1 Tax=Priestia aryabhattai TaxID=412384 RepID=UPI001C8EB4F4|nr:AbrB/MazE/SpoVT family DNA-binding domain-containing protein [Priestia aryabhattai]MBY0077926.1 AbrB family transcriptional regulator [Priestia aryabhattai]
MKALGIVRNIDRLGRFVIPMEVRRVKGWDENTPLEAFATEDGLYLKKYVRRDDDDSILEELATSKQLAPDFETQEAYEKVMEHMRKTKKRGAHV